MARSMSALKERFFSHLSPSLLQGAGRVIDSTPFTLACLCILLLPLAGALLFSVAYIPTFLYGVFSGQFFPSREIFLFFPDLSEVFSQPPSLAKALLAYAFAGFILSWVLHRTRQPEFGRQILAAFGKNWSLVSFLIIFSLLFATLGATHFSYHSHSGNGFAIAGVLPYSDANGHYAHYTKYFYDGVMGDWVLRRPVAAFMGASIHWLAGNDPAIALLLRCLLVVCAMWASCAVMNKSYGVWCAIGCMALEYAYIWNYLNSFLTEPLGFFWGCTAAALWLQGLREKRLFWDLAAFSATLVGLLTRMGSMFLVPALFLYVLWRWRHERRGQGWWKKPLLGLCLCTAAIALLNATFASRGVGDSQQTGSNFSYSFAGLTLGTNWKAAQELYIKQIRALKDEKQKSSFLYQEGIKNILKAPDIFFKRLAQGEGQFIKKINFFLFRNWYLVYLFACLLVIRHKTLFSKSSAAFWFSVWVGILLSIPFIYYDSSWRVNIFVYPLIACFFSLALGQRMTATAASVRRIDALAPWSAVTLSCSLLLLMTSVAFFPGLHTSAEIQRIQKYAASLPKRSPDMFLVDAKGMGFLVVPDGEKPDTAVPSMTWSTFRDRYREFFHTAEEPLFPDSFPKPPFGVLNQIPILGSPVAWGFFITPPEVLTRKNVLLWDLEAGTHLKDNTKRIPWKIVTSAVPALYK